MNTGPQTTVQKTSTELTPEQKELQALAMPGLKDFAVNPPTLPGYSRVAPFDPSQVAGQEGALSAAGTQQGIVSGGATASNLLTDPAILNPNTNPALQGAIDAAVRPIQENLVTSTLPAIRGEAVGAGYGGSRQGIAEGLAARGASQAIGDTSARLANEGYNTGLDAMTRGLALLPQTTQAQLAPSLTTSGVGDVRQGQAQSLLTERAADFNYEQLAPFLAASDIMSIVNGLPGATNVTSATAPSRDAFSTILGLGSVLLGGPAAGPGGFLSKLFG